MHHSIVATLEGMQDQQLCGYNRFPELFSMPKLTVIQQHTTISLYSLVSGRQPPRCYDDRPRVVKMGCRTRTCRVYLTDFSGIRHAVRALSPFCESSSISVYILSAALFSSGGKDGQTYFHVLMFMLGFMFAHSAGKGTKYAGIFI